MLTKAHEDYIEAIYILTERGQMVKSVAISKFLNVSKPAVFKAMNELKEKGLIDKDHYTQIVLTSLGIEVAKTIYQKHTTIKNFLQLLGVDAETAEIDCCKIEHVISDTTFKFIKQYCDKHNNDTHDCDTRNKK